MSADQLIDHLHALRSIYEIYIFNNQCTRTGLAWAEMGLCCLPPGTPGSIQYLLAKNIYILHTLWANVTGPYSNIFCLVQLLRSLQHGWTHTHTFTQTLSRKESTVIEILVRFHRPKFNVQYFDFQNISQNSTFRYLLPLIIFTNCRCEIGETIHIFYACCLYFGLRRLFRQRGCIIFCGKCFWVDFVAEQPWLNGQ